MITIEQILDFARALDAHRDNAGYRSMGRDSAHRLVACARALDKAGVSMPPDITARLTVIDDLRDIVTRGCVDRETGESIVHSLDVAAVFLADRIVELARPAKVEAADEAAE